MIVSVPGHYLSFSFVLAYSYHYWKYLMAIEIFWSVYRGQMKHQIGLSRFPDIDPVCTINDTESGLLWQ